MNQESRFTAPRPDCPNPEYWTSNDSDSTEHQVSKLVSAFVTALQPEYCIETGTAFGQTAHWIGTALRENGHGWLDTLETDHHRVKIAKERCVGYPVTVLEQSSLDFIPARPVDFMWIDSTEPNRPSEIARFAVHASRRCVIGIHDTGPHKQLRTHIERLAARGIVLQPLYLPTPRGVCFARLSGAIW